MKKIIHAEIPRFHIHFFILDIHNAFWKLNSK